jgi:DtxR family transcriptional regulator, Mn-dependent transcriptional regulator
VPDRSQSTEEYLEAVYKLSRESDEVGVRRLAEQLSVARPSVSEMLGRMAESGLVTRGEGGKVRLTEQGRLEGARLVRRHRLSERFLVDYLNLSWDQVHDEACKFEHVLSPEVEARLAEQLGNPLTCPHGHAIPGEDGLEPDVPTLPLTEVAPGSTAVIACITDEQPDLLRYLASLGLLPQTNVTVEGAAPFGGPLLVRVGDAQYALGREVTDTIHVEA